MSYVNRNQRGTGKENKSRGGCRREHGEALAAEQKFVYTIARKYGESEIDDLMKEGYLGMYRAAGNYDLSASASFLSYAGFWIKQAIHRYHQDNKHIRIPAYAQENISKYKKFRNVYRMYFGKEPTREQICCYLGISYEALEKIESAAEAGKAGSMDKEIAGTDGVTYGDMIADPKDNYESVLDDWEREQLKGILWGLVDGLPGRSPEVIRMRYQKDMTLDKIGVIGIDREMETQWQQYLYPPPESYTYFGKRTTERLHLFVTRVHI